MDIGDMAIHTIVCQKSDFHENSDFQNSQKIPKDRPFTNTNKKI
jgi:hypothetical protein